VGWGDATLDLSPSATPLTTFGKKTWEGLPPATDWVVLVVFSQVSDVPAVTEQIDGTNPVSVIEIWVQLSAACPVPGRAGPAAAALPGSKGRLVRPACCETRKTATSARKTRPRHAANVDRTAPPLAPRANPLC
jgi:hypothetical protein